MSKNKTLTAEKKNKKPVKQTIYYLSWLNQERYRTQKRNITLLDYLRREENDELRDAPKKEKWFLFTELMLGANFSYWRAIFLTGKPQSPINSREAMMAFLEPLAFDNQVNFPREIESQSWVLGYYINNCLHRIHETKTILPLIGDGLLSMFKSESKAYETILNSPDMLSKFGYGEEPIEPKQHMEFLAQASDALDFLVAKLHS